MLYDEILGFSDKYSYEQISKTKSATDIYKVKSNDKQYILKINYQKSQREFDFIVRVVNFLYENNFNCAKLLFSKYENSKSYFLFEFIYGNKIGKDRKYIDKIAKLMREFYNVTKDFEVEEDLRLLNYAKDIKKKNLGVLNNIFEKTLDRVKKNKKEERLLIVDINSSNFIETKSDIYMIDFDEILFGEIEFDLADFFTDFFEREKQSLKEIIEIYKEFLSYFDNYSYDVDKILDYIILILISELTPNTKDSENEYKLRGVKFILANRKIIYDMLKK